MVKTGFEELKKKLNKLDGWYFGNQKMKVWDERDTNIPKIQGNFLRISALAPTGQKIPEAKELVLISSKKWTKILF